MYTYHPASMTIPLAIIPTTTDSNVTGPLSDVLTSYMSFKRHNGEG